MRTKTVYVFLVMYVLIRTAQAQFNMQTIIQKNDVVDISTDLQNNLLISDRSGAVQKISLIGERLLEYTDRERIVFDMLDASSLKIYGFSNKRQTLTLLNRWLSQPLTYNIYDFTNLYINYVQIGANNTIWLFSKAGSQLLHIDLLTKEALAALYIGDFLKEYTGAVIGMQYVDHRLFIQVENMGVLIFNINGKLESTVKIHLDFSELCFWKEKNSFLVWADQLYQFNDQGKRLGRYELRFTEGTSGVNKMLISKKRLFIVNDHGVQSCVIDQ